MILPDNNKFVATKIRDFAKLILKERVINGIVARCFEDLVRVTGKDHRSVQLLTLWTLIRAYNEEGLPRVIFLDIQGFIDADSKEDNWAKAEDLPQITDIVRAIERKVDIDECL